MRSLRVILALFCTVFACFANLVECSEMGLRSWRISGNHLRLGAYEGRLQIKHRTGAEFVVSRLVRYKSFRYEGKELEELWTGRARLEGTFLKADFVLKRADFIDKYGNLSRKESDYKEPLFLSYNVRLEQGASIRLYVPEPLEEIILAPTADSKELYEVDERQYLPSSGDCFQIVGKLASLTIFLPVILNYRLSSLSRSYWNRPEFYRQMQYFLFDPNDYACLCRRKDLIRLDNAVVDEISLAEAWLRAEAYSYSLAEKAAYFRSEISRLHLNELGLYCGALTDGNGKKLESLDNGDGALWSGMYAGAEAMRYLLSGDSAALARFREICRGLFFLLDSGSDEKEFARTAALLKPGESLQQPWRLSAGPRKIKYLAGGNNDMIKGIFHAFAWAYLILPAHDPLREELKAHTRKLRLLRVVSREKKHPGNEFSALGLAALADFDDSHLERYLSHYRYVIKPIGILNLDKGFYYGGIADWSGVNLGMVSQISEILIAKQLYELASKTHSKHAGALEEVLLELRTKLANSWGVYAPARRDFMTAAADAFAIGKNRVLNFPQAARVEHFLRESGWPSYRKNCVWTLREIPYSWTKKDISCDFRKRKDWCPSAWPVRPWKFFVEGNSLEYYLQGACNYPLFYGQSFSSDNLWTSAFDYRSQGSPHLRHGRVDYLFMYWLGRLSGLISEKD